MSESPTVAESTSKLPAHVFDGWTDFYLDIWTSLKRKSDVVVALYHFLMTKYGFTCIGIGDDKTYTEDEVGTKSLPPGWNFFPKYALRYMRHKSFYILLCYEVDKCLIINLLNMRSKAVSNIALYPGQLVNSHKGGRLQSLIPNVEYIAELLLETITKRIDTDECEMPPKLLTRTQQQNSPWVGIQTSYEEFPSTEEDTSETDGNAVPPKKVPAPVKMTAPLTGIRGSITSRSGAASLKSSTSTHNTYLKSANRSPLSVLPHHRTLKRNSNSNGNGNSEPRTKFPASTLPKVKAQRKKKHNPSFTFPKDLEKDVVEVAEWQRLADLRERTISLAKGEGTFKENIFVVQWSQVEANPLADGIFKERDGTLGQEAVQSVTATNSRMKKKKGGASHKAKSAAASQTAEASVKRMVRIKPLRRKRKRSEQERDAEQKAEEKFQLAMYKIQKRREELEREVQRLKSGETLEEIQAPAPDMRAERQKREKRVMFAEKHVKADELVIGPEQMQEQLEQLSPETAPLTALEKKALATQQPELQQQASRLKAGEMLSVDDQLTQLERDVRQLKAGMKQTIEKQQEALKLSAGLLRRVRPTVDKQQEKLEVDLERLKSAAKFCVEERRKELAQEMERLKASEAGDGTGIKAEMYVAEPPVTTTMIGGKPVRRVVFSAKFDKPTSEKKLKSIKSLRTPKVKIRMAPANKEKPAKAKLDKAPEPPTASKTAPEPSTSKAAAVPKQPPVIKTIPQLQLPADVSYSTPLPSVEDTPTRKKIKFGPTTTAITNYSSYLQSKVRPYSENSDSTVTEDNFAVVELDALRNLLAPKTATPDYGAFVEPIDTVNAADSRRKSMPKTALSTPRVPGKNAEVSFESMQMEHKEEAIKEAEIAANIEPVVDKKESDRPEGKLAPLVEGVLKRSPVMNKLPISTHPSDIWDIHGGPLPHQPEMSYDFHSKRRLKRLQANESPRISNAPVDAWANTDFAKMLEASRDTLLRSGVSLFRNRTEN